VFVSPLQFQIRETFFFSIFIEYHWLELWWKHSCESCDWDCRCRHFKRNSNQMALRQFIEYTPGWTLLD